MGKRIAFRNRAHEVSRLEAFSDVIFGFAVSLLVVSLEAPKSYEELMEMMRGMLPFAFCFFIFIDLWFEHHHFFRRYALQDNVTIALNTVLLFVVLFYVYPLKYMFTMMANQLMRRQVEDISRPHASTLFLIYGFGFAAIFWLLGSMYLVAWSRRNELRLNEAERIDTVESILDNFASGAFGILSACIAQFKPAYGGIIYFGLVVPKTIVPWVCGARRRKAEERLAAEPRDADVVPSPA